LPAELSKENIAVVNLCADLALQYRVAKENSEDTTGPHKV